MGIYTQSAILQDIRRHSLGISSWAAMPDCWQGDIQRGFEKVIAKVIGWKDLNGLQFAKAKDRLGIIHMYKRVVDDPRFVALPEAVRSRITGPEELVVCFFINDF